MMTQREVKAAHGRFWRHVAKRDKYTRDYLAEREWNKKNYSSLHYKNLLRCPETVFRGYGSGIS
jgi:hypothetical protein